MSWQYNPYVWLPLLVAAAALALAPRARRRWNHLSRLYIWSMLWTALWALSYALQLLSANLEAAFFWLRVQMLGPVAVPLIWLAITLEYTGRQRWLRLRYIVLAGAIPIVTLGLLWAQKLPGWVASDAYLESLGSYVVLRVIPGPWFWVHSIYTYGTITLVAILLIQRATRTPVFLRWRMFSWLGIVLVTILANLVYVALNPSQLRLNLSTLISILGSMLFTVGLVELRVFDIVPVARAQVVENMGDALLVLDSRGVLVDFNSAAKRLLGLPAHRALGACVAEATHWPALAAFCGDASATRAELEYPEDNSTGERRVFEAAKSPLGQGEAGGNLGRIILLHDISALKRNAQERERLIADLQQALSDVTTLSGLLPVCAWCGKIRNDKGYWEELQHYIAAHSNAEFTHGICPDCRERVEREAATAS